MRRTYWQEDIATSCLTDMPYLLHVTHRTHMGFGLKLIIKQLRNQVGSVISNLAQYVVRQQNWLFYLDRMQKLPAWVGARLSGNAYGLLEIRN
jgi:hypothetical protein